MAIVPACKSGGHRSVAISVLTEATLRTRGRAVVTAHLSDHEWAERTCAGRCDACMHRGCQKVFADQAIEKGVAMVNRLIYSDDEDGAHKRARLEVEPEKEPEERKMPRKEEPSESREQCVMKKFVEEHNTPEQAALIVKAI